MALEFIQPFFQSYPRTAVIAAALLISLFISIVNYFVLNKEKMHEIKARQKAIQEEMKNHKHDPKKMMELQKEMFSHMGASFKHSMKPMLITFIPLIILFPILSRTFATVDKALWWPLGNWFWWYIIASIAFSMIFRKLFKLP